MKVIFVGSGPGDPELLTVKAERLLRSCRVCIYAGSLVNPEILNLLPEDAERHDSAGMSLEEIVEVYERAGLQNIDVVRLHSGDPSIYGATREQMNQLDRLGILAGLEKSKPQHLGGKNHPLTTPATETDFYHKHLSHEDCLYDKYHFLGHCTLTPNFLSRKKMKLPCGNSGCFLLRIV